MALGLFHAETLHNNYDVSLGDKNEATIRIGGATNVSVQVSWSGLTGTLDGEVKLQESNNSVDWDDMGLSITLATASGSQTLADTSFPGEKLRAVFTKNNLTGGTLNTKLIAKD